MAKNMALLGQKLMEGKKLSKSVFGDFKTNKYFFFKVTTAIKLGPEGLIGPASKNFYCGFP